MLAAVSLHTNCLQKPLSISNLDTSDDHIATKTSILCYHDPYIPNLFWSNCHHYGWCWLPIAIVSAAITWSRQNCKPQYHIHCTNLHQYDSFMPQFNQTNLTLLWIQKAIVILSSRLLAWQLTLFNIDNHLWCCFHCNSNNGRQHTTVSSPS